MAPGDNVVSDYTIVKDFSADTGNSILGADLDAEWAAIQVAANSKSVGVGTAVEIATATFTPTWTGFGTPPTGDLRYQLFGDGTLEYVFVSDDAGAALTATSDATSMTITGIPSAISPAASDGNTNGYISALNDNSENNHAGAISVSSAGTITFFLMSDASGVLSATGFTATNTKGFPDDAIMFWTLNSNTG